MTINVNQLLCSTCGNRGFKRITTNSTNVQNVPALQCITCSAIVFEHETMLYIQEQQKNSITGGTIK